jgi:uncharacterized repeat protein (TIGR01451 family)
VVSTQETFKSPWYLAATGASDKLYRITATCQKPSGSVAETAHACDTFGNCTDVAYGASAAGGTPDGATPPGIDASPAGERRAILPVVRSGAGAPDSSTPPAAVEPGGGAASSPGMDANAPSPADARPLPPAGPGADPDLSEPDAVSPQIAFASQALTTTHYSEPRTISVSGIVTYPRKTLLSRRVVTDVVVSVGGQTGAAIISQPAPTPPFTITWTFPWRLTGSSGGAMQEGDLPDGEMTLVQVVARDREGLQYGASTRMPVDVVPPAPMSLTLTHAGASVGAGDVIREPSPALVASWTPSSDGAGVLHYRVTWTVRTAGTNVVSTRLVGPAGPFHDRYTASEAELITVEVAAIDRHGNVRAVTAGPVLADSPLTPDFIELPPGGGSSGAGSLYNAWADGGCTLLGADRRLQEQIRRFGARRDPQRLYATWDEQALRLAWTGASWSGDGEMYIYMDTGPGGASTLFAPNPAPGAPQISLNAGQADWLVRVQDHETAELMRWDGGAWVVQAALGPERFRFNAGLRGGETDLYLPFELLGMAAGAPLGVLGFAVDEPEPGRGLLLWSTLSRFNPLNSPRVHPLAAGAPRTAIFLLSSAHRWGATGAGVCPNGTRPEGSGGGVTSWGDADVRLELTSDPPGLTVNGLSGGLDWVDSPETLWEQLANLLHGGHPPLQDGQQIVYTVHYRNEGVHTAVGVHLDLKARGKLQLLDGPVTLGDIAPGGEGHATFRGVVNRDAGAADLAVVAVWLHDAAHPAGTLPLGWLWNGHRVDQGGPESKTLAVDLPGLMVGTGTVALRGRSHDEAGMASVHVQITSPSGFVSELDCPVERPHDGSWRCPWNVTASNDGVVPADGERFSLMLQGVDRFGQPGPWAGPWIVSVDAAPPEVTVSYPPPVAQAAAGGGSGIGNLAVDGLNLFGTVHDGSIAKVEVCMAGECGEAALLGHGKANWSYPLRTIEPLDYVTRTVEIRAIDKHNRASTPEALQVAFDNVPPVVVATQVGFKASLGGALKVLEGTVSDGGPSLRVVVRMNQPDGTEARREVSRAGQSWWLDLAAEQAGNYTLWVDAEDTAGNRSTQGPFTVEVTCTDAALAVEGLSAQPAPGGAGTLALTAVLANAGPASLDAGVSAIFAEGPVTLGQAAVSSPVAPGGRPPLVLPWTPDHGRDYDISVIPAAGPLTLCSSPASGLFAVAVRDLPLDEGWTLVSPPLEPGNTAIGSSVLGIRAGYSAILGYEGGIESYYPDRVSEATLATIEGGRGYWIKAARTEPPPPPGDDQADAVVGSWRMAGAPAAGVTLTLAAGWNLAGGPTRPLTVTDALVGASRQVTAVLGFDRSGLSYYPDLDASYNTLRWLESGRGYWMAATTAMTLTYPAPGEVPSSADTLVATSRLHAIRAAEQGAGVKATPTWANLYGTVALPDGSPVPAGAIVTALAAGTPCGATPAFETGRFGLLACYGDDITTPERDGAQQGDPITFLVNGKPAGATAIALNAAPAAEGTAVRWPGHGGRWEVALGAALLDLAVAKQVEPAAASYGSPVIYTLAFSNPGGLPAAGWAVTDTLPAELTLVDFTPGGVLKETPEGRYLIWQPGNLLPGASGVLTVTAMVAIAPASPAPVTNTVNIAAPGETLAANNTAQAVLQVVPLPGAHARRQWLPAALHE